LLQNRENLKYLEPTVENGILFLGHADISFKPDGFTKQNLLKWKLSAKKLAIIIQII